ncbi:lung adenoma susceptibility protein 2 isoform X1 [Hypanus sabinus]|uniref:lung adenoma susceptibility protein 2 isoform X1 n=2 Tax=Hypanus sabinus TaxID=79690 RepID=UPI0028C4FD89|nr:lung adenoma susceptibility protein 2 isoform X1 [Hypanus sabinus]
MTRNIMNDGLPFHSSDTARRSCGSREFPGSVLYRGRTYQSASEALEAYIDSFEKKLSSPAEHANKLHLRSSSKLLSTSPHNGREAFTQRHSFKDSDFPARPLGRQMGTDPDLISLTTDDLLHLPADGSLPLTRTSVLKCLLKGNHHWGSHLKHDSSYPSVKPFPECSEARPRRKDDDFALFSGRAGDELSNWNAHLKPLQLVRPKRGPNKGDECKASFIPGGSSVEDCGFRDRKFNTLSRQSYPRWLTSQKSELGVSGITSVPELRYPGWLQDCDLGSNLSGLDPLNGRLYPRGILCGTELVEHKLRSSADKGTPEHKHFGHYLRSEDEPFHVHTDPGTCASWQRAPGHHCCTEESEDSCCAKPFREDHVDVLIRKAEHVLEALSQHVSSFRQNHCSPGTEEILDADRSWDNPPVTFKSPVPIGNSGEDCFEASDFARADDGGHDYLTTCLQRNHPSSLEASGRKHHGPVEALKHMLFSLQTVQQSLESEHAEEREELPENITSHTQDLDFEEAPGSKSLQRALSHLNHLKELVDNISAKKKKEMESDQYI